MGGDPEQREAALTELRKRLKDALAHAGLTKVQLVARTGRSRTTVQAAFQTGGPVPSAATVAALARHLGLPVEQTWELLRLRRAAAGEIDPLPDEGLGKPIGQWDPHDLEVHPSGTPTIAADLGARAQRALPCYVRRAHDRFLAEVVGEAAGGRSQMLVLVGSSSTGKTRACWEAVQPLAADGWRLWHPYDPTRAEAALADLDRVGPRTVVWLNEAQHYLGHPQAGERIAAALRTLLSHTVRGPVLVLGTLWPEYADTYTSLRRPGESDPHSQVRELLTGRLLTVPEAFDEEALQAASALARDGDWFLADALTRAHANGRITQDLAGAPELVRRYERGTQPVKALLQAAMDARRLGVGLHLPQAFLIDAATDYLTDDDYGQLTEDWAEAAFAALAHPVHGKQAPLRRANTRPLRRPPGAPAPARTPVPAAGQVLRLADFLEQHGRTTRRALCPPASFWHAAHTRLTDPDDLRNLAQAAENRYRLQWAHHLRRQAADKGSIEALCELAHLRERAGDREGAEALYWQAADAGDTHTLVLLAQLREAAGDLESAEALYRQAADDGDSNAPVGLARLREKAGDREGAEALALQAADAGNSAGLVILALGREQTGDRHGAEAVLRQGTGAFIARVQANMAQLRMGAGDREGAEILARQAADAGDSYALLTLAHLWEEAGDREGVETLFQQAADAGDVLGQRLVASAREQRDPEGAETLYWQAADAGDTHALVLLAQLREAAGDLESAEALARQAADAGDSYALAHLVQLRQAAGDPEGAEALARQAADAGTTYALRELAQLREAAGERGSADALARRAADAGDAYALVVLAQLREEAGDLESAEALARHAADTGGATPHLGNRWRHGLDPDGSPTPPWF
ncbi:helix-turn-helix domain-containing protein [Streptomyces sp. Caat 7-52]|uniref:helix-turn-helix domain-containing protein n=1 Tax=Streptomyces sp. Caat 7-52 TaxID=2949637 RepID=UPI002035AD89|nr:helix-turn-helix domain-containing protein [Streptomyces sp. Caat 7-52]